MLKPEQAVAVRQSWALVAEGDLQVVGVAFFLKIFEIAPEAVQLFSFKEEADLANSPKLQAHAMQVMTTVGVAVNSLDNLSSLVPVLVELGQKHVSYGVLPVHYDVVGQALLATLESGLGDMWTPELKEAWTSVYGVVSTTMIGDNYDATTPETA